jgi:uncharacterized protein GlcG (DUF336 family)
MFRTKIGILMASVAAVAALGVFLGTGASSGTEVAGVKDCNGLPSYGELTTSLQDVVAGSTGGLENDMWATIVDSNGVVCVVTKSSDENNDQWLGSRVISAQKANTANEFSLNAGAGGVFPGLALSTANLYSAVQPGGSLFGLQESNPVDVGVAYRGNPNNFGESNDPMVGGKIGGVNVFGGGLALYDDDGVLLGGLGVSGDTSCADHNIAWEVRDALELDNVPAGVAPLVGDIGDNIIYDIAPDADGHPVSGTGFGHPDCGFGEAAIAATFAADYPLGPNP